MENSIIKTGLAALIVGSAAFGFARCHSCINYTKTKTELWMDRPSCGQIKKELEEFKKSKDNIFFRYMRGDEGIIKAYESYYNRLCKKKISK
ncbi:MAG: hypothetical protein U9Q69_00035 [Nanoarchaeota archaeon]|nr:hypothetical protein [Nanoarchaeota archaeon]